MLNDDFITLFSASICAVIAIVSAIVIRKKASKNKKSDKE